MISSSNSFYRVCFLPPLFTGRLALKLVEMNDMSMHRSAVIAVVYFAILGTVEPFQSSVEAYSLGRKVGEQTVSTTDFFCFFLFVSMYINFTRPFLYRATFYTRHSIGLPMFIQVTLLAIA